MFKRAFLTSLLVALALPAVADQTSLSLDPIQQPIVPQAVLAGDREFGGNGPHIVLDVRLSLSEGGQVILAHIDLMAEETGGDRSRTEITEVFEVWRGQNGAVVHQILSQDWDRMEWVSGAGCSMIGCEIFGGANEDGGVVTTLMGHRSSLFHHVTYLADTLGDDISTDRDPHGDTSIRQIVLRDVQVDWTPGHVGGIHMDLGGTELVDQIIALQQ